MLKLCVLLLEFLLSRKRMFGVFFNMQFYLSLYSLWFLHRKYMPPPPIYFYTSEALIVTWKAKGFYSVYNENILPLYKL